MAGGEAGVAGRATPPRPLEREASTPRRRRPRHAPATSLVAYAPYLIIIAVFALAQITWLPFKDFLDEPHQGVRRGRAWTSSTPRARRPSRPRSSSTRPTPPGTLLLFCGLLTMPVLRIGLGRALRTYVETLDQLKWAILTVASVLALAYVMNLSGQTITIGQWLAGAGGFFAFLSPILGWLGVAVTGSDTSSNALFGALQVSAAQEGRASSRSSWPRPTVGRRAGQDGLAAEPRDRGRRGRDGRRGGRCCSARWSAGACCCC